MIPLIAMNFSNEMNWDLMDFVIMGIVLFSIGIAYEIIIRKSKNTVYRVAFGLGFLGAFLLFWVNAAVGIIGNEGQDANLLYGAVFVIGLVGALISRFKPKGMSITLYIVALVQMLIPAIAVFVWPPSLISWAPSVIGVFLLNAFFAMLFLVSALLFRRAALNENLTI